MNTRAPVSAAGGLVAALAAFLLFRSSVALVRPVFFDELFTRWIASLPVGGILEALRHDSGPPLYYLLVALPPGPDVIQLRVLSLLFSVGALLAVWLSGESPSTRVSAALVLSLLPAHVMLSGDARAYALLSAVSGLAVIALARWVRGEGRLWLGLATVALAAGVWTHWYGLLFLPLLAVAPLFAGREARSPRIIEAVAAVTVCAALIAVPVSLLTVQPRQAAEWMRDGAASDPLRAAVSIIRSVGPAPALPSAAGPRMPEVLVGVSVLVLLLSTALALRSRGSGAFWAAMAAVPAAGALGLIAVGRPAYFPGRFESALAVPLALMVAAAASSLRPPLRRLVLGSWLGLGLITWALAMFELPRRADDPWRLTALFAREAIPADATIVASGPMYLELLSRQDESWSPRLLAYPSEQALHPGWRARADDQRLEREARTIPSDEIWWAGEAGSREATTLRRTYDGEEVFRAGPVMLVKLEKR